MPLDDVVDRLTANKFAALADVSPEEASADEATETMLVEETAPHVAVRIGRRVVEFRDLSPRGVDMLTPPMRDFVKAVGPALASRCLVDPRLMLVSVGSGRQCPGQCARLGVQRVADVRGCVYVRVAWVWSAAASVGATTCSCTCTCGGCDSSGFACGHNSLGQWRPG